MAHISIFMQPLIIYIELVDIFHCINIHPLLQQQQEVKIRQTQSYNQRVFIQPLMLEIEMFNISFEYVKIC